MNFLLLMRLFEKTGSPIATSFLWVAYALPAILVGPFAAASVDMVALRKMLLVTNLLQSLTIFVYALLNRTSLFLLYGVAMTYSFLNQFYVPAEAATLPSVVNKTSLPQANSLFFLTQQGAMILGFGFAGVFKQFLGFETTLFVCAALVFLAFISVAFLPELKAEDYIPNKFEVAVVKFFQRIIEGYKFIREQKTILAPFLLMLALQVALAIVVINVPLIAKDILGININSAGVSMVVPAGFGAIFGALITTKLLKKGWRKKAAIELFLMIIVLSLFLLVFVIPGLSGFIKILLGIVIVTVMGLSFIGIVIPAQTYLQEATPGGLRGRVFGNFWFLATIATIFPVIFSGTIAELFGIKLLLFLLGGLSLAGLIFSRKLGQKFLEGGFSK
jgi:DHA3 family macrolide efflux protein-like MFS transporter